jgi:hypothetical protein
MASGCRRRVTRRHDGGAGPSAEDTKERQTVNVLRSAGRGGGKEADEPSTTPYTRRKTDDRDEAESFVTELFLPNRLELSGGSPRLGMEVAGLRLGALTAGRLTYGRRVHLRTADAENFHVNIPLRGRVVSRNGSGEPVTTGPGDGLVFSPGGPAEMAWSADCALPPRCI